MRLAEVQRRFSRMVLGPESDALADIVANPRGLAVYRRTVQSSLVNAIAATFPVTRRIVGGKQFADVARTFVVSHPPRRPQLSVYGNELPDFLASHELPYLADVARLEWARTESYFSADVPALDFARLAALSADDMAHARLQLHPATRLIESRYPIQRIWEVNQLADVPEVNMDVAECVLVTRKNHQVTSRAIAPEDASLLRRISQEKTLSEAADGLVDLQGALTVHFSCGTFLDT